eukprot:CAMPEP_0204880106 /NCGR_PEP_ID=MMETSP1349-20130617/1521_1 /ASSEMBLY_ACC=CAM_ASM_000710 /TAXON_ID=215587 /ORGANISM="Aplanochytrium stocchinoi, Strain GSBS06" /LENGTH=377 /DNA_ID=CAMNT_0052038353 /DNA_START=45 /DNA_END=1175 /DNA_ORIENTATION=+
MALTIDRLRSALCSSATGITGGEGNSVDAAVISYLKSLREELKQELTTCVLCARIGLLNAADQKTARSALFNYGGEGKLEEHLKSFDQTLAATTRFLGGAAMSEEDLVALEAVFPIFASVLLPIEKSTYPNIDRWFRACLSLDSDKMLGGVYHHMIGERRIGQQMDCFANSIVVRENAEVAKSINLGYKKKQTQRQKEKAQKEADQEAPPASAASTKKPFAFSKEKVSVDASTDEKINAVMNALKTLNIDTEKKKVIKHEATPDMESILSVLDGKEGIVCKNLFLKAKKPRKDVEGDSCIWLVSVPHNADVDYKNLTNLLGYPTKGLLRQTKPELLLESMSLLPGHISPFGLLNDPALTVNIVLDKQMVSDPDTQLW